METQNKIESMADMNGNSGGNSAFNNRPKEGFYQGA